MSFWDRFLAWIKQTGSSSAGNGSQAEPGPAPLADHKPQANMIKSITLSSDMKTLYLLDEGRLISFSLLEPEGVIISTIDGQLAVTQGNAMADEPLPPGGVTDEEGSDDTPTGGDEEPDAPDDAVARAAVENIEWPLDNKKQWTLTYHEETGIMAVLGATDIDGSITEHGQVKTEGYAFKIKNNSKAVKLVRKGNKLEASLMNI